MGRQQRDKPAVLIAHWSLTILLHSPKMYQQVIQGLDMARNTSVTIGNHFETLINQQVKEGRYNSASEVVRAGLRLLEAQEAQIQQLRAALV